MQKRILLVCSPNIGILDNILPLCKNLYNFEISILFLKPEIISQVTSQKFIAKEVKKIFKNFYICYKNNLFFFSNFESLIIKYNQNILKNLVKVIDIIVSKKLSEKIFYLLKLLYHKILFNFFLYKRKKKLDKILNQYDLIIYDSFEEFKDYFNEISKIIKFKKKISIFHASFTGIVKKISEKKKRLFNVSQVIFSKKKHEIELYKKNFIYNNENFIKTGNPKHDISWIKYTIREEEKRIFKINKFIFFVSRSVSKYYSPDDQLKTIHTLKKILEREKKLNLIIKLHPKEPEFYSKKIFFDILGTDDYKKRWRFTSLNPYYVGSKSFLTIVVYSGISVDLSRLGIPVVEYLNLNNSKLNKNEYFIDKKNNKVLETRFFNFVRGVSNEEELFKIIQFIKDNYKEEKKKQEARFKNNFYHHNNIIKLKKFITSTYL